MAITTKVTLKDKKISTLIDTFKVKTIDTGIPINTATCQQLNDALTDAQRNVIHLEEPHHSGATTVYNVGDDASRTPGKGATFFLLDCNNKFGNLNRIVNSLGGQTKDGSGGEIIDYIRDIRYSRGIFTNIAGFSPTWAVALTTAAAAVSGGFSDWFLSTDPELDMWVNKEVGNGGLNYSPLLISASIMWNSTTHPTNTTRAYAFDRNNVLPTSRSKTQTAQILLMRIDKS